MTIDNTSFDKEKNVLLEKISRLEQELNDLKHFAFYNSENSEQFTKNISFFSLFYDAPTPYHSLDKNGNIIHVNKAWLKLLEYSTEEVVATHITLYVSDVVKNTFESFFCQYKENGYVKNQILELKTKSGKIIEVLFNGKIQYSDSGEFVSTHCILNEVTDTNRYLLEIDDINKKWSEVFDAISSPTLILDANQKIIYANKAAIDVSMLSSIEVEGSFCYKIFHGKQAGCQPQDCPGLKVKNSKKPELSVMKIEIANDTYLVSCTPILDSLGNLKNIIHIATNITESIAKENQLEFYDQKFKSIIENTPIISFVIDKNGIFILSEGKGLKKLGLQAGQVVGLSAYDVYKDFPQIIAALDSALHGTEVREELFIMNSYFDTIYTPLINEKGEVEGIIGLANDITDLKEYQFLLQKKSNELEAQNEEYIQLNEELTQANQEIYSAKEKAIESDQLKSSFLANLSHEIRTPMNAIMGFSDLLHDDNDADTKKHYISIIQKSGEYLMSIINDIVDVSRIETGQVQPNYSTINLNSFIENVYKAIIITIPKEKELKIELIKQNVLINSTLYIDEVKLRQILNNLLTNAIKYTPKGTITLVCEFFSKEYVNFKVSDTGIGIEDKHLSIIFERFRQIHDNGKKNSGSGLGLAISKAYTEMMGGQISVTSEKDKGSCFTCRIPIIEKPKSIIKTKTFDMQNNTNQKFGKNELILIAEDDDINYFYLSRLFSNTNFRILRANNGKEALRIVDENPDVKLILMDIKMPEMNGYEATRRIQQKNSSIPIIAQTAYALTDDETQIEKAGFQGYIRKPIKREALFEILNTFFN